MHDRRAASVLHPPFIGGLRLMGLSHPQQGLQGGLDAERCQLAFGAMACCCSPPVAVGYFKRGRSTGGAPMSDAV